MRSTLLVSFAAFVLACPLTTGCHESNAGDTPAPVPAPIPMPAPVLPINNAPVAKPQAVAVDFNSSKALTLRASDADGDSLTYEIVSPPGHGTLSGTAPQLTYTPARDYDGPDSFTFRASDGAAYSAPATVWITVRSFVCADAWNQAPTQAKELHLIGIYEPGGTSSDAGPTVVVDNGKTNILVLSAYERTTWKIDVRAGSQVEKVYLNGYHSQFIAGVSEDVVELRSYDQTGGYWDLAYEYQSASTLISTFESLTGTKVRSFQGGYHGAPTYYLNQLIFQGAYGASYAYQDPEMTTLLSTLVPVTCLPRPSTRTTAYQLKEVFIGPGKEENGIGQPELHFVGAYEGSYQDTGATIDVTVRTGRPTVLVLSSYEELTWRIHPEQGTQIVGIYVTTYEGGVVQID